MAIFLEDMRATLQFDYEMALDDLAARRALLVRRLAHLVEQEEELRRGLNRAREGIPHGYCPNCWVEDGERSKLKHERDYRYDRTDDNYGCTVCGKRQYVLRGCARVR